MALRKRKQQTDVTTNLVQIKSKFDAEFRRFSLPRPNQGAEDEENWSFEAFRVLLQKLHRLDEISFLLTYADPKDGDLLPINNNENFRLALTRARPLLRVFVSRDFETQSPWTPLQVKNGCHPMNNAKLFFFGPDQTGSYYPVSTMAIGKPRNFRHVSTLIDADQMPPSQRKVRLRKSEADGRPLGLYIRDGWNLRKTPEGENIRVPGIFISRLVNGGLAESIGVLSANDEILEVNGIFVGEGARSLDQVTDMMVANAADLIITVRTPDSNADSNNESLVSKMEKASMGTETPEGTLGSRKKAHLRSKRKDVASSVFYLDESDHDQEDHVINFISSP